MQTIIRRRVRYVGCLIKSRKQFARDVFSGPRGELRNELRSCDVSVGVISYDKIENEIIVFVNYSTKFFHKREILYES